MGSTAIQAFSTLRSLPLSDLRAVLFDMDGVLYDSMPNHTLAWERAMASVGISIPRDEFYLHEGRTGEGTIDLYFERLFSRKASAEEKAAIYAEKSRQFNLLPPPPVMGGALSLLKKVKAKGVLPLLVTGSGQRSLLEKLEQDFPSIFAPEYMVTAFDVQHGKPHPEPYLMGLEKGAISAAQAIVVENAPLGIESAAAAGLFTIAVQTGPIPPEVLYKAGANLLYPTVEELCDAFDSIYQGILPQTPSE